MAVAVAGSPCAAAGAGRAGAGLTCVAFSPGAPSSTDSSREVESELAIPYPLTYARAGRALADPIGRYYGPVLQSAEHRAAAATAALELIDPNEILVSLGTRKWFRLRVASGNDAGLSAELALRPPASDAGAVGALVRLPFGYETLARALAWRAPTASSGPIEAIAREAEERLPLVYGVLTQTPGLRSRILNLARGSASSLPESNDIGDATIRWLASQTRVAMSRGLAPQDAYAAALRGLFADLRERRDWIRASSRPSLLLNAHLHAIDGHSRFLGPELDAALSRFSDVSYGFDLQERANGFALAGIGSGSPAAAAGFQIGDVIVRVDGALLRSRAALERWTPVAGAPTRFEVLRLGRILQIEATPRALAEASSVEFRAGRAEGPFAGFDVMTIRSWELETPSRIAQELRARGPGSRGLAIDLRGNGGGYLEALRDALKIFVGDRLPLFRSRAPLGARPSSEHGVVAETGSPAFAAPLVVLVDRESASSSEAFAGALQDLGRAVVVGAPTYGKGTIQTRFDLGQLPDGRRMGALRLTTEAIYLPSGRTAHVVGLAPDIDGLFAFAPTRQPWPEGIRRSIEPALPAPFPLMPDRERVLARIHDVLRSERNEAAEPGSPEASDPTLLIALQTLRALARP